MVKKRLIAVLLYKDGRLVQSINFKHPMALGNALTKIDFFNMWAIDEIILLDISRTKNEQDKFYSVVKGLSRRSFVPLTVGGWVTTLEEIRTLLTLGADKVTINTKAFQDPHFIRQAANKFGAQCIVGSIDAKRNGDMHEVFIDRGAVPTYMSAADWAKSMEEMGAGEIFLTSIDNDGGRRGYDLELMKSVTQRVSIPVIAFGGVWTWDHLVDGINKGGVDAVAVGNVFHFREHSTKKAKEYMIEHGIDVRESSFFKVGTHRNPEYQEVL